MKGITMKCPICRKSFVKLMSHLQAAHPEKYEEECDKAIELFLSGLTLRQIGENDKTLWGFSTTLGKIINEKTGLDLKKEGRKRASKTMKAGHAQGKYKLTGRGRKPRMKFQLNKTQHTPDQPYDSTNSTNPWLIRCHGTPITGPEGKSLTPEYIWSKQGQERIDLVEWVFNYYRTRGYPIFSMSDPELKKDFERLKKKDSSDIFEQGHIKNSNTVGLSAAKHFTSRLFLDAKGAGKTKSCIEAFNDDEAFRKVLKNRMGWKVSREDGQERPYVFGINDKMITQGMRSSAIGYSISHFKPLIAKFVYDRYNVKSTIDFSAGWGARCLAALSRDMEYYAIDPLTHKEINQIIEYFGGIGKCIGEGSESLDYSVFPQVDIAFSCPPYFDLEIYDAGEKQSSRFNKYNDWLELYWTKTVEKCAHKCKYFSFIAVESVNKNNLLEDMCKVCVSAGMKLIEQIPIKVARNHLSGKKKNGKVSKKTERLVIYSV